ncbi:InlB B-repeat-containing protein [Gardnerella vaginalis]|uniref:InlB B-repeat-containing protein n=1 Tax=Gardnerella vaginalis TaxID=2702 RepID=UPI0039F0227D
MSANVNEVDAKKRSKKVHKRVNRKNVTAASMVLVSTLAMILPSSAAAQVSEYKRTLADESVVRRSIKKTHKNLLEPLSPVSSDLSKRTANRLAAEAMKSINNSVAVAGVDGSNGATGVAGDNAGAGTDRGAVDVSGDASSYTNPAVGAPAGVNTADVNGQDNQKTAKPDTAKPDTTAQQPKTETAAKGTVATKPESTNSESTAQSSDSSKAKQPEVKPSVETPAANKSAEPETSQTASAKPAAKTEKENAEPTDAKSTEVKPESTPTAKQDAKQPSETKQPEENAGGVKPAEVNPAENQQPANAQSGNAESAKPAASNTDSENTNPVNEHTVTTTTSAPAAPANNAPATPTAAPAGNASAPSASTSSAGAEANAGAGTAASTSTDTTAQDNKQKQSAESSTQGSQGSSQGSQSSAEGATTGDTGEDKSATPSATAQNTASEPGSASSNNPTSSPASTSTPNAGTQNAGTPNAGATNTATDPNSQVIKPNEQHPTAGSTSEANAQVQTDKKPRATYNLKVRYTIGGAANKQLVQPYELTIDKEGFDNLGKDGKYEYIELPKSAGYRPSVYHSGDYQYYIKKGDKFVIDDGTDADAIRYLRLDKKLITDYAVKERSAVGGNNVAQAPQTSSSQATTNPQSSSSTEPKAEDGIQYYGELNINYAPKTAKYYVRHLVQDLDHKDEFYDAPNLGIGKVITVKYKDGSTERIHVTEITGTVGSNVSAISTYIPGYEPEHNLISSPLSDSDSESDKLILNLRYYRKAYDVTYDTDGGTDVTAQKVYYQQPVPKVATPTKRGYRFKGWSVVDPSKKSDPLYDGNDIVSLDDYKMPDHNVQFRANWEANKTTSYRVNVWVQKADLVDKEHPDSLANYDFVGLVERKNVQTDSKVALDKMNDAGVVDDTSRLNGSSEDDYVADPELGLTRKELQGTEANKYKDGLIAKFNWMNDTDTAVTDLDGYDTEHPGAATNKGKDLFTRYFHVNKDLTKKLNSEEHDFVPGRPDLGKRIKSKLCADDLNNTLNLVYDRNTYELIFAKPAVLKSSEDAERLNNAAIKRLDENGKTTIYCYAGGGNCSEKYDEVNEDEDNNTINHKGYRVNVRYGQSLTGIWPDVNELDFGEDTGSLGWRIGYAGGIEFRDTPPYRFTKKEFADPKFRVVGNKHKLKISDNPDSDPNNTYELKDNQRLITADTSNIQVMPIQVIIVKQSIASAKKGNDIASAKKGNDSGNDDYVPGDDDYVLSTDSYSKDDTSNKEYPHKSSSIAGFNSVDKEKRIETHESDDFDDTLLSDLYSHSIEYKKNGEKDWDDLDDKAKEAFKKEYNVGFRNHLAGGGEDSQEYEENGYLVFKYNRQSYDVQFYNADGNAIKDGSVAAKEKLPFEYSLTKRGNDKLTDDDDKALYYNAGKVKSYDASVTKDNADNKSKQFDGKYTFTLNGNKYSITRPDYLPEDYVFKGWAVDQAGIHLINGKINDNSEGTEGDGKAKGETKDFTMPVNGIKLYAAWGKPEGIKHTVTLNYNMPETDEKGKEKSGTNVVTKKQFDHYYVIKENKDIKVPTRKGYDFYGWEITKNGTTLPYAFGNKVVEDITLKAVWVEDTRYNGTFKHIFLKPGYTFDDYKREGLSDAQKAAMVDHISTQTVSGLREHLRYNAEAVYSDETHFPDKHFTSFEASSHEEQNTGEFVYQTYNTRKYKVRYVTVGEDGKEKDLLPESEVSSVNRKYDVAFYKPIEGFMPETTQQNIEYATDEDGKQIGEKTITFKYKDVRVLKRKDDGQARPDHYTRYVFKVDNKQSSMGSVVDWQGNKVADGSALVYDAIKGTKAYQMPLPTVKAKPGFEFVKWTSQIGSYAPGSTEIKYATGLERLPIRSEEQNGPEVIYTANFKLKAPVAAAPQVLTPTEQISTTSGESAKRLITNADEYPEGATFSFAPGEKFDSTPGLHKIKVQVKLGGEKPAEAEVLYRVLPDLVYASDWDKFKTTDYGSNNAKDYVPITFTGKNDEGTIIGHDTTGTTPSTGGTTTLTAYVYKGKDVRIRVPQAFGADHSSNKYHYVFKGWATKVVEPTVENPNPEQKFDINSSDRYADANLQNGVTYHAVYKKIDYFSSSSDGGEVPKDAVVAIFKPAPGRLWDDKTSGPKVFYVKKGTDLEKITKDGSPALDWLNNQLTGAKGTWSRSSMRNDGSDVKAIEPVTNWTVNESFQEFVADQTALATPNVKSDTLLAIRGDGGTLPSPEKYIANYDSLIDKTKNPNVTNVTVKYASTAPNVNKAGVYTVPLIVRVTYNDFKDPSTHKDYYEYKTVGKLKVMHDLIYGENVKDLGTSPTDDEKNERKEITNKYKKVNFITNNSYGTMASGSRTLFYAHTNKTSGVRAPQAIGKDYDADGYHYEFVGWKKLDNFTKDNSSAELLTTDNVKPNEILQSSSISTNKYDANTTYQAVYKRVENVIDASKQDEIPDGYVATIFLPGFGRTWADGSYKPKLLYIRHGKDKEDNIKFAKKVASDTAATLSGFTKWQMYNARGDKSNIFLHDNWDISKPRIFVAEQNGVDDVKIPETVIGVGDEIPNANKLVHNTDPKVSVSIDDSSTVDVSKPGISTIMVNVTKPIDETDTSGKQKTVTTKLPVRVYVLPKVIANNDLPAEGTAAAKFIEKNYTKVTYVAGDGGSLQKSPLENAGNEPVSVYWVRNDANGFLMQVPDVLANKGYVFKNWTSITTETPAVPADKRKATEEEREALARLAKIDGMHYVAKLISDSRNSTLAALQNLLNEAQKQHAAQVYNAKREELAKIAESKGNTDLASNIRKSNDSLQNIKNNMLTQEGIDVDEIVEHNREKALLAKIAKEAGNETLAEEISKSNDSLDDLSKKLEKAGIDLAEYDKLTFDKKKEALAQFADINGLHYVASIIRASHESSLEAFKNLIKSAKPDVKIPAYKVNEEDYASEEQRELLIQIAEEKERPDIAAKIRLLHSSTLQDLKKLFDDEHVYLYAIPDAKPKKEITITANFEKMDPVEFKFSGKAIEGVPATFTLANLTKGVLKDDGTPDINNTKITVDSKEVNINELVPQGLISVNGINANCAGTACTISGTPKIVNGKPKVELTFTTTDKYGREAKVTVEIDVISESKPAPTPVPTPPTPAPVPTPEIPFVPDFAPSVIPEAQVMEPEVEQPETEESQPEPESKPVLAKTGSDTSRVASAGILSAAIAAIGLTVVKTGKHHRKRRNNK